MIYSMCMVALSCLAGVVLLAGVALAESLEFNPYIGQGEGK